MGYYPTPEKREKDYKDGRILKTIEHIKTHPNYEDKHPIDGETLVAYTLRCIAHMVSPPQIEGESTHIECVDLKECILAMQDEIQSKWDKVNP